MQNASQIDPKTLCTNYVESFWDKYISNSKTLGLSSNLVVKNLIFVIKIAWPALINVQALCGFYDMNY